MKTLVLDERGSQGRKNAFSLFFFFYVCFSSFFVCFLLDCENVFKCFFFQLDCESNFVPSARVAERRTFFHAATRPQEIGRLKFDFFEHLVVVHSNSVAVMIPSHIIHQLQQKAPKIHDVLYFWRSTLSGSPSNTVWRIFPLSSLNCDATRYKIIFYLQ